MKRSFAYDWFNSLEKLDEAQLPPKVAFYSKLNSSNITDDDFEHAIEVWEHFKMTTTHEYHHLYMQVDVLLLTDVYENFRSVCLNIYGLDPCWYFTAPGLAWHACLRKTDVKLELLNDVDMLLMFEKGIRGGVSMIPKRYAKANNKYMKDFNLEEESKFIQYLDANNLFGWAMSQSLPVSNFKWMTKVHLENWREISSQEDRGCILEVDLEYPKELQDLHNDHPLAPERIVVNKVEKLIPTLRKKDKYVLHHRKLKQYLEMGMNLTKIHRGISFDEDAWLKPYIKLNAKLRTEASSEFENDFFKLMNNSVFGKTMENIRNRVDIRLRTDDKSADKLVSKPNYQGTTIFTEDLVAVHMKKTELVFSKPVYLGMSILDISKTLMYDFHYNYIKKKYGPKAKLLLTHTDSLMCEIHTEDFFEDIREDIKEKFDTSNFENPKLPRLNKKVPGIFKVETGGKTISDFVGLRAKSYAFDMDEDEFKKCKGVKNML